MAKITVEELRTLSIEVRLKLVEDIWDTIANSPESLPVTDKQRQELDRRLARLAQSPELGRPWNEVRADLLRRLA